MVIISIKTFRSLEVGTTVNRYLYDVDQAHGSPRNLSGVITKDKKDFYKNYLLGM